MATSITVVVGTPVKFAIAPTGAGGVDAKSDVPGSVVVFSLSDASIGSIQVDPNGYSGTVSTPSPGVVTLNVQASPLSGGLLQDSGVITITVVATALNLSLSV